MPNRSTPGRLPRKGTSWTNSRRTLAVLLGLGVTLGLLLSPLGFETRSHALRTVWSAVFFSMVGIAAPIAGFVLLFPRPKLAALLAVVDAAVLFVTVPADQAGYFFTLPPPTAVTIGEFLLILVAIGYMLYGPRVHAESRTNRQSVSGSGAPDPITG
jgi:hypothetical protein